MNIKHFKYGDVDFLLEDILGAIKRDFENFDASDVKRLSLNGGGFLLEENGVCAVSLYSTSIDQIFVSYTSEFLEGLKNESCGYMGITWVDVGYRGMGLQKDLIGLREEVFRGLGIPQVISLAGKGNLASFKSFLNSGYEVKDELEDGDGLYMRSVFHKKLLKNQL